MSSGSNARRWLQENKVFFETLAAMLLSVMAVLVSVFQSCVATKQTRLISLQTRVAESQVVPQFFLEVIATATSAVDGADEDRMAGVVNRGGGAHEIDVSTSENIIITTRRAGRDHSVRIPTTGYSELTALVTEGTGEVTTVMVSQAHRTRLFELMEAVAELNTAEERLEVTGVEIVLLLEYKDVLNRPHSEYFTILDPDMLIQRNVVDPMTINPSRSETEVASALPFESATAGRILARLAR